LRRVAVGQQVPDQPRMALRLDLPAQPAGGEDRAHLVDGGVEVFVDDDVVELVVVGHLLARRGQAPGHDFLAVLPALAHALVQRLARWRQDEHAHRPRHQRTHLARALPVDLQQHVAALGQARLDRLLRRALPVAVHQRMLEEVAGLDHARELLARDEVVVLGVALARPRITRGVGDRQADVRVARQAGVDDAGFPGTGRRGDDEQGAARGATGDWGLGTAHWHRWWSPLFNVLHLLADLVDQHFQFHRDVAGARIDGLGTQGVG